MPEKPIHLLLVDDDTQFRDVVAQRFRRRGFHVLTAASAEEALQQADRSSVDVAVLDLVMPGTGGLELLSQLKGRSPHVEVLILTGQASIPTAIEAMKRGAYDYLMKPCELSHLELHITKAYEKSRLATQNVQLREALGRSQLQAEIVGSSRGMQDVLRLIEKIAPTESSILIRGESGTGKELVARALHRASRRSEMPLVIINCAAMQETLLESELFGHEKGAFTGAITQKKGLFDVADGGTIFVDEIGEMGTPLQAKLLRVLEDGTFRPVGSTKEHKVDVRVLAATNKDLEAEIAAAKFREDLYYRLNVISISLPPLRERTSDIPALVEHFLATRLVGGRPRRISPEALAVLQRYDWPGNVRELSNVIERAQILAEEDFVQLSDLPDNLLDESLEGLAAAETDDLAELERHHIEKVLQQESGNKMRAAKTLGISRRRLYRLLDKYHLR